MPYPWVTGIGCLCQDRGLHRIYRFALQVVVVTSVAILVVQVEEFMGRRFFMGFLLGWYDKPREAERVVLSIDLVGSSALNERSAICYISVS